MCKIDRAISFEFIYAKVKHLYSQDNSRPAIVPVMLFKMLLIGCLFGIRAERQLVREIEVNLACRWCLGLGITDPVPHAATFTKNRQRRFNDSGIYQEIFDEIVLQAVRRNLVDGQFFTLTLPT